MQEWLNWHAWKACIPLKGIRGSNPLLSADKSVNQASAGFALFSLFVSSFKMGLLPVKRESMADYGES